MIPLWVQPGYGGDSSAKALGLEKWLGLERNLQECSSSWRRADGTV
jgi:hypothetical protein